VFEASDARGIELKGTFDFTGGTGKYKGITGKNAWRSVGWWVGRTIFNNGSRLPRWSPHRAHRVVSTRLVPTKEQDANSAIVSFCDMRCS